MVTLFAGCLFFGSALLAASSEAGYRYAKKRKEKSLLKLQDAIDKRKAAEEVLARAKDLHKRTKEEYDRVKWVYPLD
jgi:hypothetical protein